MRIPPDEHTRRLDLYQQGLSDSEIAAILGMDKSSIRWWRKANGLPSRQPPQRLVPEAETRRMELYRAGSSDPEIAGVVGTTASNIRHWRKVRGLPANRNDTPHLDAGQNAARLSLYKLGYSDGRIARIQHVRGSVIERWRRCRGLPHNGASPANRSRRAEAMDPILLRVQRAIGRGLPRDIRDDAISDLYVDVTTGVVGFESIEKVAHRYGNRVLERYASKFGPRSLDEEIGEDFSLMDTLVDERASPWLEEMGATVS